MTAYSEYLAAYDRIRPIKFRLNKILTERLSQATLKESGSRLGILEGDTIVLSAEAECAVLLDYAIYNCEVNGRNGVQAYFEQEPPPPESLEMAVLKAMLEARYTLLEVMEAVPGVGMVVKDLLTNDSHFLCEIGLSRTATPNMVVATRVVAMEGFLMACGAALPASAVMLKQIAQKIESVVDENFRRFTPRQEAVFAAFVIRGCRAAGVFSYVAYRDPGTPEPARRPARPMHAPSQAYRRGPILSQSRSEPTKLNPATRRIGRNTPCPCGSGSKFKVCCGRS